MSNKLSDLPAEDSIMKEPNRIEAEDNDPLEIQDGPKQKSASIQLFQLASPADRLLYFVALLCSVGSGTIMPLMTLIFGNFVTVFTAFSLGDISHHEFLSEISTLYKRLYFIYLFIAKLGLSYLSMVLFTMVSANVTSALQQRYLHAILGQRIAFHETKLRSGIVNEALSNHSNAIRSGLSDKFGMTTQHASTVVTAFVVAMTSVWNLALAVASVIPAAVIVIGVISVFDEKLEKQIRAQKEEASTLAEEVFSSVRTVRSLGQGASSKLYTKYENLLNKASELGWKRAPIYGIQIGTYMMLLYCAYALAFWYGMHLYASGKVEKSGKVITTLFSIMIGMNSFSQLAAYLGPFMTISTSVKELFNIINAPVQGKRVGKNTVSTETSAKAEDFDALLFQQDIVLNNVSFRYPTRPTVKVLESLSLTISGGKQTAFVGQSGCGKSTIIGLLLRWYDVESGSIAIGGMDLMDIPLQTIRSKIGFVSQEPQLFSGTIFENVANGLLGSSLATLPEQDKKEKVIQACKVAHAHDFISQLPDGYETHVGDRGTQLSGGQKQRIAIARAIVKDPPILIFDEATSALDTGSEAMIQRAIESASRNRTIVSIAHRLRTIQKSDQIYVLGRQTIIEQGNHESLIASPDSLYGRLWKAQSLDSGSDSYDDRDGSEAEMVKRLSMAGTVTSQKQNIEVSVAKSIGRKGTFAALLMILSRYRRFWLAYTGLVIGSIIAGALFPVQAVLYAKVVSAFQLTGKSLTSAGNFWALMWFVLALAVAVGYLTLSGLGSGLGEMVSNDYRSSYFEAFLRQPIAFFDERTNSPGSLIARLSTDPEAIKEFSGGNISVIITVVISLVSTIALALAIGWKFALVVLAGGLPFIFAASYVRERMEHTFEDNAAAVFNECVGYASECIQAIRTVVSLNMEEYVEARFGGLLTEHSVRARKYALRAMVWFALSESIELLAMALAFWYGGTLLVNDGYSTEQFFIVFIAIVFGSQSAGSYFAHSSDISKGVSALNAIRQIEHSANEGTDVGTAEKLDIQERLASKAPVFEIRNVDFAYPARPDKWVLKDFTISMQPGQFIAIVGESGSGKSTITGILERFYRVSQGDVEVLGSKVDSLSENDIHEVFSMVSQEPVLYQGSVRDNLVIGTSRDITEEELDEVTAACQLTDLIQSLPEGYCTMVGSRGAALSGGQRQRIAIARALIRKCPVLLLDEATSALDSVSEKAIHEALLARRQSYGGMLVIAHRLSTVKAADVIYVMHQGKVVEIGSHSELIALQGRYLRMWRSMESGEQD